MNIPPEVLEEVLPVVIRLIETLLKQGKDPRTEIAMLHAQYSLDEQRIMNDWDGSKKDGD